MSSESEATARQLLLGVNVDHVATLRQARGTKYPDPVFAAFLAEQGGANQITIHLREDRRHIQERDLAILRQTLQVPLNLEMAATPAMAEIALKYLPDTVTLVPERREEQTTEGGLDAIAHAASVAPIVRQLADAGIVVSLFIDPQIDQVRQAVRLGAATVELHTGDYANLPPGPATQDALKHLREAAVQANRLGLRVAAGHGLDYHNVHAVAELPHIEELNIGHSLIAKALFVGLERAVREMIELIRR